MSPRTRTVTLLLKKIPGPFAYALVHAPVLGTARSNPTPEDLKKMMNNMPLLMGSCAGAIKDIKPAKEIIDDMVSGAIQQLQTASSYVQRSKL
jgi:hypothetical protein